MTQDVLETKEERGREVAVKRGALLEMMAEASLAFAMLPNTADTNMKSDHPPGNGTIADTGSPLIASQPQKIMALIGLTNLIESLAAKAKIQMNMTPWTLMV